MKADPSQPRFPAGANSLIATHLSPDLYRSLARIRSKSGFTLDAAIRSGLKNPDSSIGIYAGDSDSYACFAPVMTPIIRDYHKINDTQGHLEQFTPVHLSNPDPEGRYIRSTRIRVARNLKDLPFCCHIRAGERVKLEKRVIRALEKLPEGLAGDYISFNSLSQKDYTGLVQKKLAFPKGDRFQEAAGLNRDFPLARGVFLSHDKGFRVWVNEEDHLRIMALESGPDLSAVFNRLCSGLDALSPHLAFAFDPELGFLSSCPTNIGTAMRAGVHIRLKKLEQARDTLNRIVARHHLQIRGTGGEKTAVNQSVFDISNARRLGVSANDIIRDLHTGISAIIEAEKNL
ncbi:MAG: phosphagen kinase [Desulfobacterales bacterium]|nr:phosphagen kinase [Desulfobacterales bacterium]